MKFIKQFSIIITIQILAEILVKLLSIPLPGTVFGMGILLILFLLKIIKIKQIKDVGDFLLSILIILYIPTAIGVVEHLDTLVPIFLPLVIILSLSTIITLLVTGYTVQLLIGLQGRKSND